MQCPVCNLSLTAHKVDSLEVDQCDFCHGLWLDYQELNDIKSHKQKSELTQRNRYVKNLQTINQDEPRKCPRCVDPVMDKVQVRSVTLDICKNCKGTWYDAGELVQIAPDLEVSLKNPPGVLSDDSAASAGKGAGVDGIATLAEIALEAIWFL